MHSCHVDVNTPDRPFLSAALRREVMAGAQVTVSSEEVMTAREEEGEHSSTEQKSQVLLHLQPVLHG